MHCSSMYHRSRARVVRVGTTRVQASSIQFEREMADMDEWAHDMWMDDTWMDEVVLYMYRSEVYLFSYNNMKEWMGTLKRRSGLRGWEGIQDSSHGDGLQSKLHVIMKTCLAYKFQWPLFYHHGGVPWFVDHIMGCLALSALYKSIIMKESPKEIMMMGRRTCGLWINLGRTPLWEHKMDES